MSQTSSFILKVITKLESLNDGMIVFAYKDFDRDWWIICLSDYYFYKGIYFEIQTSNLLKAWRIVAKKLHLKLIFCYLEPTEQMLERLNREENLILNI